MAISKFVLEASEAEPRLVLLLEWTLRHVPQWNLSQTVCKNNLVRDFVHAYLKSSSSNNDLKLSCSQNITEILEVYCQALLKETVDLEEISKAISGILEGILISKEYLDTAKISSLAQIAYEVSTRVFSIFRNS